MATKTTDKKTAPKKTPTADRFEVLADEILVVLLHRALVRLGEPARVSEIAREIEEDSVSVSLIRHTLETHPRRFVAVDRRWDIAQRYLDKQRPVEKTLEEIVANYGAPMPAAEVPGELAQIFGRVREYFDEVAPRFLKGSRFFPVSKGLSFGLRSWLLNIDLDTEDDLLFYNFLTPDALTPFKTAAAKADWESDPIAAAVSIAAAAGGGPVDNRLLQYFAFRAQGEEFDGEVLYDTLAASGRFLGLPDHRWMPTDALEPIRSRWRTLSAEVADLAPEEAVAEAAVEAPAKALEITDEDLAELQRYFADREEIVTVPELLTNILEVRPGSRTFADDAATLTEFLRSHPNEFLWVGTERFRAPGTLPPYIGQIPESLTFPTLPRFETADGEILDQSLSDEAFEDNLSEEILDPVAQDVNDQEPEAKTSWPEGVSADARLLRLVLKAHHKEIGTFPLAQIPHGFFPIGPSIVEMTLLNAQGNSYPIYADYDVQLVYGLFDVYSEIAAESGAVFTLEKTDKPDEFRFISSGETDANVFASPNRVAELSAYRSEVEEGPAVSTYDLIRTILDHYRKGTSFLTLLTEINLVRRTPRRLLASILSGYSAFHPRANRWTFDAKKEPEGFDKSKTEFLLKR